MDLDGFDGILFSVCLYLPPSNVSGIVFPERCVYILKRGMFLQDLDRQPFRVYILAGGGCWNGGVPGWTGPI